MELVLHPRNFDQPDPKLSPISGVGPGTASGGGGGCGGKFSNRPCYQEEEICSFVKSVSPVARGCQWTAVFAKALFRLRLRVFFFFCRDNHTTCRI